MKKLEEEFRQLGRWIIFCSGFRKLVFEFLPQALTIQVTLFVRGRWRLRPTHEVAIRLRTNLLIRNTAVHCTQRGANQSAAKVSSPTEYAECRQSIVYTRPARSAVLPLVLPMDACAVLLLSSAGVLESVKATFAPWLSLHPAVQLEYLGALDLLLPTSKEVGYSFDYLRA